MKAIAVYLPKEHMAAIFYSARQALKTVRL